MNFGLIFTWIRCSFGHDRLEVLAWLRIGIIFLIPYKQAVDELKVKLRGIRAQFLKLDGRSPIEFVTGRVKPVDSIKEKKWFGGISQRTGLKKIWKILPVCGLCVNLLKIFIKLLIY